MQQELQIHKDIRHIEKKRHTDRKTNRDRQRDRAIESQT